MLHLLQFGPSKVLTTLSFQIQNSLQLSLLEFRPCGVFSCNSVTHSLDSSGLYTSTVQSGPSLLMLRSRPTLAFKLPISFCPFFMFSFCSFNTASCSWLSFYAYFLIFPPDTLRIFQWNASDLLARSTELLHFLSSHPVDLIYIQESNLNSSSSFRIPGFSALRSDRTHSRSGILSRDATHASNDVIIFIRQGLFLSELSNFSLSSLDSYSDSIGVNISLLPSVKEEQTERARLVYAPPIRSSSTDGRTDSFSPSILPSFRNLFILGDFNCHYPLLDLRGTSDHSGKYSIESFLLTSSPQ